MSQQAQMMEATLGLIAAVSEVGGGPWEASPGLTARALTGWMGEQEDRVEELMERLERKRGELTRLAEVEEEDRVPSKTQPIREPATSLNPGSPSGERENLWRPPHAGRAKDQSDGQGETSTPAEEGLQEERRQHRRQASRERIQARDGPPTQEPPTGRGSSGGQQEIGEERRDLGEEDPHAERRQAFSYARSCAMSSGLSG